MPKSISNLSVVLPAYNEEQAIGTTINSVYDYLKVRAELFEIIVVNDGSADRTSQQVLSLSQLHPEMRLIEHPENRGYGQALRTGFNAARYEWILLMDSDGQFNIESLRDFWFLTDKFDIIAGYRQNRADSWPRSLLTWGYSCLMAKMFSLSLRDIGCGFKLFRRAAWQAVQPVHSLDHKIFTVEWMWRSRKGDFKIKEIPVRHYPRLGGQPTGARLSVVWAMIKALFVLRTNR